MIETQTAMFYHRFLFAVLLGFSVSFFSCSCGSKTTDTTTNTSSSIVKITEKDDGKTFHVKTGEAFEAVFNECVGCAEVWRITAIEKDKIETLPNTYSGRTCTDCNGGSQMNTFHFKAKAAGTYTLAFAYFDQKISVTIVIG